MLLANISEELSESNPEKPLREITEGTLAAFCRGLQMNPPRTSERSSGKYSCRNPVNSVVQILEENFPDFS